MLLTDHLVWSNEDRQTLQRRWHQNEAGESKKIASFHHLLLFAYLYTTDETGSNTNCYFDK